MQKNQRICKCARNVISVLGIWIYPSIYTQCGGSCFFTNDELKTQLERKTDTIMRFHVHGTWRLQKNPTIPTMSMQQLLSDVNVCDVIWLSSHVVGSVRLATSVHVHGTTSDVCASETWHTKIRVDDGDTYARIKIHTHRHTHLWTEHTKACSRALISAFLSVYSF